MANTELIPYSQVKSTVKPTNAQMEEYLENQNIVLGETQEKAAELETDLTDHTENEENPHNVTAHQVGTLTASEIIGATGVIMRNTAYTVGDICKVSLLPNNFYVECIQAGTTAETEPTYTPVLNSEVLDGTAKFRVYRYANTTELGFVLRNTAYVVGDACFSVQLKHNMTLVCTQAGTTAGTEPTITNPIMGMVISDGTAKFTIKPTVAEYCNTQPTTTSTATPYKPVVCIENYYDENSGDWYRKYSDGFIEQGGTAYLGTEVAKQIVFGHAMKGEDFYQVNVTQVSDRSSYAVLSFVGAYNLTATGFVIQSRDLYGEHVKTLMWRVAGF